MEKGKSNVKETLLLLKLSGLSTGCFQTLSSGEAAGSAAWPGASLVSQHSSVKQKTGWYVLSRGPPGACPFQ